MFPGFRRHWCGGFFHCRLLLAVSLVSAGLMLLIFGWSATASNGMGRASKPSEPPPRGKVAQWVLDRTANGQEAEFLVLLADQADLREARSSKMKLERRRKVRDALWEKANQTQQPILEWLEQRKIEHRAFYIVNAIWVKADAQTATTLAARSDVVRIEGNPQIRNRIIETMPTSIPPSAPDATTTVQTGIAYSHAPQVWALGYTGQGVVIGGADTGYRWTHTALKSKYRGWNGTTASHDYNWHDSVHSGDSTGCVLNSAAPCDDNNHGTHTMGTAVGDDGLTNQIGMAPGAKWIGCRNMNHGFGTPARYIECMEFFLAPYPVGGTPAQGDPTLAPDITTNSWACPDTEGCAVNSLQAAVEAQRAAGIFMVVAAGNEGQFGCHSVMYAPGIYDAVYSVGALNNGTDTLANFSSRGSVTVDSSNRMKPDISAPGTNVLSSTKDSNTSYDSMQGTSMATPHVAGAVALLWSAQPLLRNNVEATEAILNQSAFPIPSNTCSSAFTSPNNAFGYGRLDVKAAVDYALLRTTAVNEASGAVQVKFYAGLNRTYRLEYKAVATDVDWAPVPGAGDLVASADGEAQLTDPNAGAQEQRYYRVRIVN